MKTSNSVLCAVVVAVLGLSAVVSPPQAAAGEGPEIEYVHPASMCVKLAGGANIVRLFDGSIANNSTAASLGVSCDVVNKVYIAIGNQPTITFGTVSTRDLHPSANITCGLCQAARVLQTGVIASTCIFKTTEGASPSLKFLSFDPPDPTGAITGLRSNNFFTCSIPPASDLGASTLNFYSVREDDLPFPSPGAAVGMRDVVLEQEIKTVEMRVEQAFETEQEDPKWSQRAVTSWTQVFQKEGIKEELKGIQFRNIACRTTLCRMELAPIDPAQGGAAFEEEVSKLTLFAPWQGASFGIIENPDGQAPRAVLYLAREGHRLP
jgi:hypothetical protein